MLFEIKRLFKSKAMLLIVVLSLLPFLLTEYYATKEKTDKTDVRSYLKQYTESNERAETYEKIKTAYSEIGTITPEEMAGRNMFDIFMLSESYDYVSYEYENFNKKWAELVKEASFELLEEKGKDNPDRRVINKNEKIIEEYNNYIELPLVVPGSFAFYDIVHMRFPDIVFIMFIIAMSVILFTTGMSSNAEAMIRVMTLSRKKLLFNRWSAALLVNIVMSAVYTLYELHIAISYYNVKDLSIPIQTFQVFSMCPFRISVGAYFILDFSVRMICGMTILSLTMLLSYVLKNNIAVLSVSSVLWLGSFFVFYYYYKSYFEYKSISSDTALYKVIQICRTFLTSGLFDLRSYIINLDMAYVGVYVLRIAVCILTAIVISVLSFIMSCRVYGRKI